MIKIEQMIKQFEENKRFHKVRGLKFSKDVMKRFGIRGIYNMTGEVDQMGTQVVRSFCAGCIKPLSTETAFVEASFKDTGKGNPLKVVSVMVFEDRYMYNLFALNDGIDGPRYLDEDGYAEPILSLLN